MKKIKNNEKFVSVEKEIKDNSKMKLEKLFKKYETS